MIKEICDVLAGSFLWTILKIKDQLDYSKVVLVLSGENKDVDKYALVYLDTVIDRKRAAKAVIYVTDDETKTFTEKNLNTRYPVKIKKLKSSTVDHIYRRYTIEKFYKNLFWTYTDKTRNNLLGRFIRETEINAEDVVCLAIYNLRQIPNGAKRKNVCS